MTYPLTFEANPQPADVEVLGKGITAYAQTQRDLPPIETFANFIRDEQGNIIGGCNGAIFYGCMYVEQLWLAEPLRGQGYGTKLMKAAETYGKKKGCTFAAVNTMDFEALGFYQKLGYKVELARKGFMKDSIFYFLRKDLS
jgi:GNAT superfamily N-acetyltransferase